MNPNPIVYGNPETWDFSYINGGLTTDAANALKIQKAKVPRWDYNPDNAGYWNSQLRSGITEGKITQNVPIDKTICAVGMGRDCPYATMGYFRRSGDEEHPSDVMLNGVVGIGSGVVNGFLWEMRDDSSHGNYNLQSAGGGQIDEKQMEYRCWAPESNNIERTNKQNGNYYIAPYTYFQLKTFIASLEVNVCNSEDVPDDPTISGVVPTATWRPIDTWKNSYSTHKITGFRLNFARANQILDSGGRITYTRPSPPSQYDYTVMCGFGVLDEIQFDAEYDYKRYMYALFADGAHWRTVVFQPFTDTTWNSSVHRVGFMGMYDKFNGDIKYLPSAVWYQIDYSDDVYEQLCRAAATFGFIFVTDSTLTLPSAMNTNNICFPVINDEGIANGDYTRGTENLTNDLYNADSTRDKNYDPTVPIDKNTYSNVTGFNTITSNAALTKFYVLDSANVEKLGDDLWTICDGLSAGDFEHFEGKIKDEFLTTNPIDSIIALKRFPFNIPHTFNPNKVPVQLGKTTGSAQGYRTYEILFGVNFKGVDIFPRFGDCFLDYSPYTKYELYIPFCGTVEINAGDILGHTLNCQLLIDLLTGSCMAYILADQLVIGTAKGSCGVDMQMSGAQTATMNANIFNGILNAQLAETQHITSIGKISLNPFKWYENIEVAETRQLQTQHDITHMVVPLHKMGSASPLLSWVQEFNARLMIYYPEGDVITSTIPPELNAAAIESFGHIKGFATATPGKVNSFQRSGKQCYLSGNIVADSIPCTDNERQRIIAAFNTGVYLPSL